MVREWSLPWFRQHCRTIRAQLADQEVASAEDLASFWPGGAANPHPGKGGWFYCYGQYARLADRLAPEQDQAKDAVAREAALDALRERPKSVQLLAPSDGTDAESVSVYPKSFATLVYCEELDANLRWLREQVELLRAHPSADSTMAETAALAEIRRHHLTLCWVLTHPGVGAPFDMETPPPSAPESIRSLTEFDVVAICLAHIEVNGRRLQRIGSLLGLRGGEQTPLEWSTLAIGAARKFACPAEHLLRDRSLVAWVAQLSLTVSQERGDREREEAVA